MQSYQYLQELKSDIKVHSGRMKSFSEAWGQTGKAQYRKDAEEQLNEVNFKEMQLYHSILMNIVQMDSTPTEIKQYIFHNIDLNL